MLVADTGIESKIFRMTAYSRQNRHRNYPGYSSAHRKSAKKDILKQLCLKQFSFIKTALQNHEIIDILGKQVDFNDPIFEIWLKKRYFKME
jgi:hypothetical protein